MYSVPRIRRLAFTLHLLEKGRLTGPLAVSCGVEREGATALHLAYGRSVAQILEDHRRYAQRIEAMRAVPVHVVIDELAHTE